MEKLIKKGAEADIYLGKWFGRTAIYKIRCPRSYRQPKLDEEIRRHRTQHEVSFLYEAKIAGVMTPSVYFVDPKKAEIVMQFVNGERLKELLHKSKKDEITSLFTKVGNYVAMLHKKNIVHGDLTTSNFIIINKYYPVLIDFGLAFFSRRIEDFAVDLHLMKEVITSAHSQISDILYHSLLRGYTDTVEKKMMPLMLNKIKEIERRGRYARVE